MKIRTIAVISTMVVLGMAGLAGCACSSDDRVEALVADEGSIDDRNAIYNDWIIDEWSGGKTMYVLSERK